MIVRKWIDVCALLIAGVVLPVGIIAMAFALSRDNGDAESPPPTSTVSSVPSPSSTGGPYEVPTVRRGPPPSVAG